MKFKRGLLAGVAIVGLAATVGRAQYVPVPIISPTPVEIAIEVKGPSKANVATASSLLYQTLKSDGATYLRTELWEIHNPGVQEEFGQRIWFRKGE